MDKSMDRWSPARGRIGGTPRRVAARSSPRLWSALDHTIGIIEPVETDAEDNDSKGHDEYEEHDSARDTHRRLVSFEGQRFVEGAGQLAELVAGQALGIEGVEIFLDRRRQRQFLPDPGEAGVEHRGEGQVRVA